MISNFIPNFDNKEGINITKFKKNGFKNTTKFHKKNKVQSSYKKIEKYNVYDEYNNDDIMIPLKNQEEHLEKIINTYDEWAYYFDHSIPGSGKSCIALLIARRLGLDVLLIAPPGTFNQWEKEADYANVRIIDKVSYHSLASSNCNEINHPYLTKSYNGKNVNYEYTSYFDSLLNDGILVVFDESSMTKNDTNRSMACATLMKRISCQHEKLQDDFKSRFLQLSGTPVSNINQIIIMLRNLGLISSTDSRKLVCMRNKKIILTGMNLLKQKCDKIDSYQTEYIISKLDGDLGKNNVYKVIISLYICILKPIISGGLPGPDLSGINLDIKNKFYKIPDYNLETLNDDISQIIDGMDNALWIKNELNHKRGSAVKIRIRCNQEKVDIVVNKIIKSLNKNPSSKFIVLSEFVDVLKMINDRLLESYIDGINPRLVSGDTNKDIRNKIYRLFNKNSSECNVLLASKVVFHGINLQDTHGDRARTILFLPSSNMEDTYQGIHRAHRVGSMSDCKVRMVYIYGVEFELKVIAALSRQSRANKLMLNNDVINNTIYPDEFECVTENNYPYDINFEIDNSDQFETYDVYNNFL